MNEGSLVSKHKTKVHVLHHSFLHILYFHLDIVIDWKGAHTKTGKETAFL